ncbi:TetR/AcrR family transcriptional regulator [Nocardioides immobilis]|uniref:TetR/AcrR family transcriptional regulator n=1 Tax=Nocardioides immobilis TaxID=2049295 RepID=A0A417XUD5_9ACTN|nr:TetR/AcrR family transcriptional regulator [Nocardioides immobilis]RHW24088.1 TetR/AcrR family transcriptional regulator [Nocardioides immobilis]
MTYVNPLNIAGPDGIHTGSAPDDVRGVRPPRQRRSKESLDRVLAAGVQVLVDGGYAAFTINEVARRAGASSGLIYARFEHKAALFEAVMVHELTRMVDHENAAIEDLAERHLPTADLIEGIVRLFADIARREAPLTHVFMERTTVEPSLTTHVKELRTAPLRIAELLVQRADDLRHTDSRRAADMAFWIITSALERRVHTDMWRHWESESETGTGPDKGWDLFVTDLVDVVHAFLLADDPSSRSRGT